MKNWRRKLFTLLFMVVLMLGLTVTAYAASYATINAEGGKFTARQDSGSWQVDQIKVKIPVVSSSMPTSGSYDFLYNGSWYPGTELQNTIVPARTGYTFGGHFTSKNGGGTKYYNADGSSAHSPFSNDKPLYAYWTANKYTVTLDANGGTIAAKSFNSSVWNTTKLQIKATYDSTMPNNNASANFDSSKYDYDFDWNGQWYEAGFGIAPALKSTSRAGYTLLGYFDAKTGGTKYYNADGTSARTWNKTSNTTLYAQWTANTYTITYKDGGSTNFSGTHGKNAPTKHTYGTATTLVNPSKTGYTFGGWFTASNCTGTAVTSLGATSYTGNITLYAKWTENTATLTYNANGKGTAPKAVTMKYTAATNAANAITGVTGYTFSKWTTNQNGTGTAYNAGAQVKAANTNPTATTLYAQWTANTYTVTLNNGEGSGDASVTATYGANLPEVTVPTWVDHVFCGYYTKENGEGDKYIDKDGKGVKVWDKASDEVTLYAYWKDSAKIESMDLTLGGDIGMRFHVAVNDPDLQESGTMTVSIGSKKPSTTTKNYSEAPKDESGAILFPFNVNSIQMAEPVKVEFKDGSGNVIAQDAKSVEDYYKLVEASDTASTDQKEMVRTLLDYGYYAQQALSMTRGWSIGSDYKASTLHGSLNSSADDLKAYKPVISGTGTNVKDIQISLLLDNKTTLCVYVQTKDGTAPSITVDGKPASLLEDNGDGWWLVRIPDIDALNLSTMHTVTANGYTVYLSALSYASVASDSATINAMRALRDYNQAALKANGKTALTSATVEKSEYEYTGEAIKPVLSVMAGDEAVTDYKVVWSGELIDAGTYTGLVTKDGYVGGVTVTVTITPKKVEVPTVVTKEFTYDGEQKTVLTADENALYTLSGTTAATDVGSYTATATLKDKENTCWDDGEGSTEDIVIEWSIVIVKTKVEKPTATETSFEYDGMEKTLVIATSENYTITGNTGTDAGKYIATVTLNENCCWSDETTEPETISWTITKKEIAVPDYIVKNDLTYTGEVQTGVTVEENAAYTLTDNTGTAANNYTATLALTDTTNTCWNDQTTDDKTIQWSIAKKQITVPAAVTGLVYDGTEQTGVNEGEGYTLSGTIKATNADSYTATAALNDMNNTCWNDQTTDDKTIQWSIAQADPTSNGPVTVTRYPNGGSPTFSGSMSVPGTFSYDNGTTTFTPEDTQNYNTVPVSATVTTDETPVTVPVPLN